MTRIFHTVVPYLELLINSDLVARVDGDVIRYQTTPKDAAEKTVAG